MARALSRLPTDFRAALLLRVEEGLSFRQIAEVLNLTEETARWRVFKARQKLLGLLAHSCGWSDDLAPVTARALLPRFRLDTIPHEPFVLTPELLRAIGYVS